MRSVSKPILLETILSSNEQGTSLASNDDDSFVDDEASSEVVPAPAFITPENEDSTSEDETFVEE